MIGITQNTLITCCLFVVMTAHRLIAQDCLLSGCDSCQCDSLSCDAAALACENVARHLDGREPKRVIVVPGRLVNVVG